MTSRLICTAEMDLPDNALDAAKAQAGLLEFWKQFVDALPEQGLSGVRIDARVVKAKAKSAPKETPTPDQKVDEAGKGGAGEQIPGFLKRA